ncbi:glutathione S-transferase family protein [Shimia sp. R10_1]|uniref:glutathione S-transferase family protein n=1 Tax=Shimia sp. R10_1 TaxID=2821095 RepID=UPI001ADABF5C|nr:glutathione S-transferase family protein [Shimia sp. R10_1]MBO9473736.1 glutathione S-transferase family protein [Shimia sp. R10_1]
MHLVMFPGDTAMPTYSPFCLKALCLLEMAGEDWQPEYTTDVTEGPLGKLPFLRYEERLIPDSSNIEDFLTERGADFYPGLSHTQICQAHALKSMVEHSLVLGMVHDRWLHPDVWPIMREAFFAEAPSDLRDTLADQAQESVRSALMAQGIARFSAEDRQARFDKDLAALDATLGGQPFLFGAHPTAADATIAPVLDMIQRLPADTDLRRAVMANTRFKPYVDRVRASIYPDMSRHRPVLTSAAE